MTQERNEALTKVTQALDLAFKRGAFNLSEAEDVAKSIRILLEGEGNGKYNDPGKGSKDSNKGASKPGK